MGFSAVYAVIERELLKMSRQRGRMLAALVRPLLWLLVIGAGFTALENAHGPAGYQAFLVPGVVGMTLLFGGMIAALSTAYDKESGVMRMLIIAPIPHYWIVLAKTAGAVIVALIQALALLVILGLLGFVHPPDSIWILAGGLLLTALACASLGMVIAAWSGTVDNFATLMNLVIFPAFFLSGSLYPVERLPPPLKLAATLNPYTHGVDLLRHAGLTEAGGGAFAIGTDVAWLLAFSAGAIAAAAFRFEIAGANESLVHRLAQ
jgi:ABC-2 type transport system permease protein